MEASKVVVSLRSTKSRSGAVGSSSGSSTAKLKRLMDTKLKGDIAEQSVALYALKQGWGVLKPLGDRLPYDLVFDVGSSLFKIQVKSAWFDAKRSNYVVDKRRTKTNRRQMLRENYKLEDFDFAIIFIQDLDVFYIMPSKVFNNYGSEIHLVEADKRQRKPNSSVYRNAWDLILHWAVSKEISK